MKGFKLHQDIDLLNITLKIFYGNYLQLNHLLDAYENGEINFGEPCDN